MALGAATVWEVRSSGALTGGGGFDSGVATPGTDYSQQDAAQDSGTDLACADGDAATPTVTSASHNFVAADEGNIINITEAGTGFTLGRYVITDTAANGAILDRACGADGALTGGDWYLGGAVDHPDTVSSVVVDGNDVYVKAGTYQQVGANDFVLQCSVDGTNGSKIQWIGYNTARTTTPKGDDRPLLDGQDSETNVLDVNGADFQVFQNLRFTSATADNVDAPNGSIGLIFVNCYSEGAGDGATTAWGYQLKYSYT